MPLRTRLTRRRRAHQSIDDLVHAVAYADGIALIVHSRQMLQPATSALCDAAATVGLSISPDNLEPAEEGHVGRLSVLGQRHDKALGEEALVALAPERVASKRGHLLLDEHAARL